MKRRRIYKHRQLTLDMFRRRTERQQINPMPLRRQKVIEQALPFEDMCRSTCSTYPERPRMADSRIAGRVSDDIRRSILTWSISINTITLEHYK